MTPNETRIKKLQEILRNRYPIVKTQLNHENPFQLLISTILSAQCTDKQVNKVTQVLFKKLKTPEDFSKVRIKTLEKFIYSTGFYKNKAKNIKNCSKALIKFHKGNVPATLSELIELPGVGRKTANVVLGCAFGVAGMVVDTHVARISKRLALTENKDPVRIEFDLMEIIPKSIWNDFSLHLIYFGREICMARNPVCGQCPLIKLCPFSEKNV